MAALPCCGPNRSAWTVSRFATGLVLAATLLPGVARAQIVAGDWTPNGIAATSGPGEAMSAIPVPDESGGLYIVWVARPVGGTATEVRVRRAYSSGTWDPHWPTDGVLLGPNSGVIGAWREPSGGLVVSVGRRAWRLTSLGTIANGWPAAGKLLEPLTDGQFSVGIDQGGRVWALGATSESGCYYPPAHPPVCWSDVGLFGVRLDEAGQYEPGWEPPGKFLLENGGRDGTVLMPSLKAVPGGVAFAFMDREFDVIFGKRRLSVGYVLNNGSAQVGLVDEAQIGYLYVDEVHWDVDATGAIFANSGRSLATSAVNKHTPNRLWTWPGWKFPVTTSYGETARLFADDAGGAYVQSIVEIPSPHAIRHFIHHVLPNGTSDTRWPLLGIELSYGASLDLASYASTSDGRGGYFATWPQSNGADTDIHAVRLLPDASTPAGWSPAGTPVCNLAGSLQSKPVPVADQSGNLFVVWLDSRNGPPQVFAQKIGLDSPVPVAIASSSADLEGGSVRLRWRVVGAAQLIVERSTDGIAWSVLNEPELEPSSGLHELVDEHPVRGEVNRYRLREEDLGWIGGEVSILVPALTSSARLAVVPNPVSRASRVSFTSATPGEVNFSIHDLQGREMASSSKAAGSAGEFELEWDALARLPRGLYWLRMRTPDGESRSVRFVVAQ